MFLIKLEVTADLVDRVGFDIATLVAIEDLRPEVPSLNVDAIAPRSTERDVIRAQNASEFTKLDTAFVSSYTPYVPLQPLRDFEVLSVSPLVARIFGIGQEFVRR